MENTSKQTYSKTFVSSVLELFSNNGYAASRVDIIKKYGYPVEIYPNIITEDNYLLDIYRIPHGRNISSKVLKNKPRNPVLLMHGLYRTSRDWVLLGPKKGLALLLADKGYDVWLPNLRGTIYSRKHVELNPDTDRKYWEFSWHEMGLYDMPAILELMRNTTKKERFSYVGVSQGTTVGYVFLTTRPEYNRNITVMISLAPIAYLANSSLLVRTGAALEPLGVTLAEMFGMWEILQQPLAQLLNQLLKLLCIRESMFQDMCAVFAYITIGNDPSLNKTILGLAAGLDPGTSIRELFHSAQIARSGLFRAFDLGAKANMQKYGTVDPPMYNLSKITVPVALIYSDTDELADAPDAVKLGKELMNCVYLYRVPVKFFNHFDFLIANDVVHLVFSKVFYLLQKYDEINV